MIGTKDFVEDMAEQMKRLEQPFVILVLDGPNYSIRTGTRGKEDATVLVNLLQSQVLPALKELL